jgi:hypothetical protein
MTTPRASDIVRALESSNDGLRQRAERAERVNRELRKRVIDLEGEVSALKPQIGLPASIRAPFRFSEKENAIFTLLMARDIVSEDMINTRLYSARPDGGPGSRTAQTYLCNLRRKVAKHGFRVSNDRGVGWFIPHEDKVCIRQLLNKGVSDATPTILTAASPHAATHRPREERRPAVAPR